MRKISLFSLLILSLFALSACSSKNTTSLDESGVDRKYQRPDFGQPESRADIVGVVKSTIGNEVAVYTVTRPEKKSEEENKNEGDNKAEKKTISSGTKATKGGMRGMRPEGDSSTEDKVAAMKKMSSGEDKLIIPVGIKMLKKEGDEMVEASLADVVRDKIITVWLNNEVEDRKIAEFVIIN